MVFEKSRPPVSASLISAPNAVVDPAADRAFDLGLLRDINQSLFRV